MSVDDRLRDSAAAPAHELRWQSRHSGDFAGCVAHPTVARHATDGSLLAVLIVAAGMYAATGSRHAVSVTPAGPPTSAGSTTTGPATFPLLPFGHRAPPPFADL